MPLSTRLCIAVFAPESFGYKAKEAPKLQHAMISETLPPSCRLLVCVGPRCDEEGRGSALLALLRGRLAAAKGVACVPRECLRVCTREPVVRLEPSGEVLANPDIDELVQLTLDSINLEGLA